MSSELEASIMIDGGMVAKDLLEFEGTLEEMILEGWRLVKRNAIFAHDENLQQRAGLAGVMIFLKEADRHEEYRRIEKELEFWKAMSAAISGVPVDFGRLLAEHDEDEVIGISKLWNEFKEESEDGD